MSAVTGSGNELAAPSAPSAVTSTTTGLLDTSANYYYKVTYVNAWGESAPSAASAVLATGSYNAATVTIPVSSDTSVTARKIYRTVGGGTTYALLATVSDNTTTTYSDIIVDASLGAAIPDINSALTVQNIKGLMHFNQPVSFNGVTAITAGTTQTQAGATAIGMNQFVTVTNGNAGDGVILPALTANMVGMAIFIQNLGAAVALNVYPNTGATITSAASVGSANAALSQAAAVGRWYVATSATNWTRV